MSYHDDTKDDEFGWKVRRIDATNGISVMLDTGISYASPCFAGAEQGQLWAVHHERKHPFVFGCVEEAICLTPKAK